MQAFWKFNLLRVGLFLAVLLVLRLLQFRGVLLVLAAAVISLALSYVLLRGPRDELAAVIAARVDARTAAGRRTPGQGIADDAAAEDAAVDGADAAPPVDLRKHRDDPQP